MSLWERETERQRDITICQCQTDAERLTTHAQYEHPAAHQHHSEDQKLFYILRFSISEFSAGRPCHLPASATWYYSSPQVLQLSLSQVSQVSPVSFLLLALPCLATQSFYKTTFGQRKTNKKNNAGVLPPITGFSFINLEIIFHNMNYKRSLL